MSWAKRALRLQPGQPGEAFRAHRSGAGGAAGILGVDFFLSIATLLQVSLKAPIPGAPGWLVLTIAGVEAVSAYAFAVYPGGLALAGLCSSFSAASVLHIMLGEPVWRLQVYTLAAVFFTGCRIERIGRTQGMAKSVRNDDRKTAGESFIVERVQTGFRMEKRMLKVLKALAEYHDLALGDLVEGIVLHAFEGESAFGKDSLKRIADFKRIYGLNLNAAAAHRLVEKDA